MKPWFLYLIECADRSIYTGIALDVGARFKAHLSGKGAHYTRSHPPLRVLASLEFPDRSTASKAEYRVKQLTAAQKRSLVSALQEGEISGQSEATKKLPEPSRAATGALAVSSLSMTPLKPRRRASPSK
jgi:putative endonuclease